MRRIPGAAVGLACVALLSSCALRPPGSIGDEQQPADTAMQHIADAVNHHGAGSLKKLFSTTAREKATDLDNGLAYFLRPDGAVFLESKSSSDKVDAVLAQFLPPALERSTP